VVLREHQAVREARRSEGLQIVGDHEVAPAGERCSLRCAVPGEDATGGHTDRDRRVAAVPTAPGWPRLTLTLPALNSARHVHVLATSLAKARAVSRALIGEPGTDCPVSLIRPADGQLLWMIDAGADHLRSMGGKRRAGESGATGGIDDAGTSGGPGPRVRAPGGPKSDTPGPDDGPWIDLPGEIELE